MGPTSTQLPAALAVTGAALPGIAPDVVIPGIEIAEIAAFATEQAASFETATPAAVPTFESGVRPPPLFRAPAAGSPLTRLGVTVRDALTQGAAGTFMLGFADPFGYGDMEGAGTSSAGAMSLCAVAALIVLPILWHIFSSSSDMRVLKVATETPPETDFTSTPPGALEPAAAEEQGSIADVDLTKRDRAAVRIAGEKYPSVPPRKGLGHDFGKGGMH